MTSTKQALTMARLRVVLLWAVPLLPVAVVRAQESPRVRTDVPVQRVMLFSSGVGYFEHAGRVRDEVATELRFKTSQINDILKSLVIQDQDGGKIGAITYASQDPLEKTLRSFQVDITQNPSLAELLNQLRGARVTVATPTERISGTVLGVETRYRNEASGQPIATTAVAVLNLLSGASIRSLALPSVSSFSLDDPALQDELRRALLALSQARDQDKKPVTINFSGVGDRRVRIGYVVETPIWKTSYRLLLDKTASRIQGWAIVENQTESDWNGVALSLVSGRPISFSMDLYQPLYATRPVVTQELFEGLRPQVYESGIAERRVREGSGSTSPSRDFSGRGVAGGVSKGPERAMSSLSLNAVVVSNPPLIESVASAARMGELFQYTVNNVSLARQKSAMLPIVADSITAERVSIFNASVLPNHPLNGVRVTNTTGKHLLQGPVTVLDEGGYAGDAQIDNLPPGQQRLLSYGIDLDVRVNAGISSQNSVVLTGRIARGLLFVDQKNVSVREYHVDNRSGKAKVLITEHPITAGASLVGTQKPVETTDSTYRFQSTVAANAVIVLTVREEQVWTQSMSIVSTDLMQLEVFARGDAIPRAVRDAILKVASLKAAISQTDRQITEQVKQQNDIGQEQIRLRENMKTVVPNSEYYQRLLEKLNAQESVIESLQRVRGDLQLKRESQQREFDAFVSTLEVG